MMSMLHVKSFRPETSVSCPACPEFHGKKIVSLDGVFGLKRWKKSGTSVFPPRHKELFFVEQKKVDDFVANYTFRSEISTQSECSQFQAANNLRSKSKTPKIDETGVFGAVCRHEMPLKFFSLRHGEKLCNSIFLINTLLQEQRSNVHLYVLYDIGCKLKAHLKAHASQRDDIKTVLENVQLAVPAFHIYAHKPDCQMKFSPRRLKGFGLSDGEQVERLWSYLRNFSSITKEMTPSNRIDALTDALIHHSRKTSCKLVPLLTHRYKRAVDMRAAAVKELSEVTATSSADATGVTQAEIRAWIDNKETIDELPPSSVTAIDMSTKEQYFLKLKVFFDLGRELQKCSETGVASQHMELISRNIRKLHTDLTVMEAGHPRWTQNSTLYLEQQKINEDRKRLLVLHTIHNLCVERWFLVLMKKRYADGQAIANRLADHINKSCTKIKKEVAIFNKLELLSVSMPFPSELKYEEVVDVTSPVWNCLQPSQLPCAASNQPLHMKRYFADLLHKVDRCNEEVELLKTEMGNISSFLNDQLQYVNEQLKDETHSTGTKAFLLHRRDDILQHLKFCGSSFNEFLSNPISQTPVITYFDILPLQHTLMPPFSLSANITEHVSPVIQTVDVHRSSNESLEESTNNEALEETADIDSDLEEIDVLADLLGSLSSDEDE